MIVFIQNFFGKTPKLKRCKKINNSCQGVLYEILTRSKPYDVMEFAYGIKCSWIEKRIINVWMRRKRKRQYYQGGRLSVQK